MKHPLSCWEVNCRDCAMKLFFLQLVWQKREATCSGRYTETRRGRNKAAWNCVCESVHMPDDDAWDELTCAAMLPSFQFLFALVPCRLHGCQSRLCVFLWTQVRCFCGFPCDVFDPHWLVQSFLPLFSSIPWTWPDAWLWISESVSISLLDEGSLMTAGVVTDPSAHLIGPTDCRSKVVWLGFGLFVLIVYKISFF